MCNRELHGLSWSTEPVTPAGWPLRGQHLKTSYGEQQQKMKTILHHEQDGTSGEANHLSVFIHALSIFQIKD